jgi:hypothetical protein
MVDTYKSSYVLFRLNVLTSPAYTSGTEQVLCDLKPKFI